MDGLDGLAREQNPPRMAAFNDRTATALCVVAEGESWRRVVDLSGVSGMS